MEHKLKQHILLVDDDKDDCDIFKEALDELGIAFILTVLHNGMELLDYLSSEVASYPDILFLDLNMPRKSGLECIKEMKSSTILSTIPIVIYSTSFNTHVVDELYDLSAHYYIQKPSSYKCLKKVINQAIHLISKENKTSITRANFVIKP
ncbi:response regulator [uncultured Maribacter sp.]|uniref:response regulator n=1 Tax=uncultured Maribacter sp. TaxID=431308 RepID=UPI0030EE8809|tara:strand:- start:160642 stop:161091 length:450 start_codon:yes stop_codon:yes gene_type:complete